MPATRSPPEVRGRAREGLRWIQSTLPVSKTQDTALPAWCAGRVAGSDTLHRMRRRLPWILGAIALVAIVVVGLRQAPESKTPSEPKVSKISPAQLHAKLDGAPPALAALHAQANDLLPGARKGLQARRARAARPSGRGQRLGRVVRAVPRRAARACSARRWTTGKRVAFLGVDLRDNRGAGRRSCCSQIPLTYPSYEDPDGQGLQRLSPGRHAEHDLLRRRGQADLHPPGPVPGPRAVRRRHQALRRRRDRGPPGARPVRGRRRAGAALRVFCVEQGVSLAEELDGRDGEALHLVVVDGRSDRRHLPPARRGLATSSSGAWRSRRRTAGAAWPPSLLIEADARARELGARRIVLAAQLTARPSTSEPATPPTATSSSTPASST